MKRLESLLLDNKRLEHIDLLRGIAILMVIAVHSKISFPLDEHYLHNYFFMVFQYGQMGVQLFFVMSAYTLCYSMSKRQSEPYMLYNYMVRRFFRIAPLYYFGILLYMVIMPFIDNTIYFEKDSLDYNTMMNILLNIFFLHGFYEPANNTIVPGGWSIATEMLFYVIFPILFFAIKITNIVKYLLMAVILNFLIAVVIYTFLDMPVFNGSFYYYSLVNQLSVFLVGAMLYLKEKDQGFVIFFSSAYMFIILTAISIFLYRSHFVYSFQFAHFFAALSFISLFFMVKKYSFLNIKIIQKIGKLSFSMYILHFIVLKYSTNLYSDFFNGSPYVGLFFLYIGTVALTYILAVYTEGTIERKGISFGKKILKSGKDV